ncbi:unnamed protein product [Mycena citricolor]|nr:unnamed protein product [Mycena citricolor]
MQDIPRPHSPDSPYLIHRRYRNYRSYIRDRQKTSVPAQTTQTTPSVPAPKIPPHDIEICAFFGMFPKCRFIPGKPYTQMVEELILAYRMNAQDARHAREQLQGILNRRSMALTSARNVHSRRSSSSDWLTKPALHVAEDDERQYTRAILAASPSKKRKTSYETDRMPKKPRLRLFAVAGPVSETHRDNQTSDPLAEFFAEYPAFKYNPRSPISAQYQAMCGMYGLRKPAKFVIESPSQRAQREKVWERYRIAMGRAFAHQFGRDAYDLRNWQGLCVVLDISPVPGTIEGCKIEIRALHVNIVDLLDTGRTGRPVRKFESEAALAKYTREHRKIFPKQEADTLLSHLLRFLAQYWPGVTRR